MSIRVISGDITQVSADAIITGIHSLSTWQQGVDGAIRRVAGSSFHDQVDKLRPLDDGQVIVALSPPEDTEYLVKRKFNHVIFVVDDGLRPLSYIILDGLRVAHNEGFYNVTIPAIRMGKMHGVVEKTSQEVATQMLYGVEAFLKDSGHVRSGSITFVIYNDPDFQCVLTTKLDKMK